MKKRYMQPEKNRNPRRIIIVSISVIIIAGLAAGIYFNFFNHGKLNMKLDFPGSMVQDMTFAKQKSAKEMKSMFLSKLTDNTGVLEYYQIAGKSGNPPAKVSEFMDLDDQLELLSFYAEQKNEKDFKILNNWINEKFQTNNGFYADKISSSSQRIPAGAQVVVTASQIRYCRILLEGYARFGRASYFRSAKNLSESVYPLCKADKILPAETRIALPEETPTPDYSATPSPKSTMTPAIDETKIRYINAVDLSEIELYALKILSSVDDKWNPIYMNCVEIVKNALISDPVPLFEGGYDIAHKSYIPFLYQNPEFIFEDQMKIALHLAEISELNEQTFAYLKQQLFNTKSFYQRYSILTGIASTEDESITGYAMMARVARIREDKESYELCIQRIAWNTATISGSSIYQLPFRTMPNGGIRAFSSDVTRSLKALY
ncbi:MAG: hypothetical protein ACYCYI_01205 [Saccharofermentanales bacterium]